VQLFSNAAIKLRTVAWYAVVHCLSASLSTVSLLMSVCH